MATAAPPESQTNFDYHNLPRPLGAKDCSYVNDALADIEEEKYPDGDGVYQELADLKVDLEPELKPRPMPNDDYHDSVEFSDLAMNRSRPTTPHIDPPVKRCTTQHVLLIISGIILFVAMIVIIGVLASHLVADNNKQGKEIIHLETKLSQYEKRLLNLERKSSNEEEKLKEVKTELLFLEGNSTAHKNEIADIRELLKQSDAVQITQLKERIAGLESNLTKLEGIVSAIHCGVCERKSDENLVRGYYCDCRELKEKRDCLEFYQDGVRINGIYNIHQVKREVISVYCDQTTDGGGWTVIQRRQDGSENFYRDWNDYLNGFGPLVNEHWLGNKNIYTLTLQGGSNNNKLRIDLEDWEGKTKYAVYDKFEITDEDQNYKMSLGDYRGDAGDSLTYNNGQPFSTKDKDNDPHDNAHCALNNHGAWWYKWCTYVNLNGKYYTGASTNAQNGIIWKGFKGVAYSLKSCEMKVRRNN